MYLAVGTLYSTMLGRLVVLLFAAQSLAEVVNLDESNFDATVTSNKLVFVNFYADWCRFSQMLTPSFAEAAEKIEQEFPQGVKLGRVDADAQQGLAGRFHISKYPTLKLFRNGQVMKREYRGQRSPDAFFEYIKGEMREAVRVFTSDDHLNSMIEKQSAIGYFNSKDSSAFSTFEKASSSLKDECPFFAGVGSALTGEQGERIFLRTPGSPDGARYEGDLTNYDELLKWASHQCVPLVREITFANAEALTEEGLPFLILFHDPNDQHSVEVFTDQVKKDLLPDRSSINFIHADGLQFSHPLHHLGKVGQLSFSSSFFSFFFFAGLHLQAPPFSQRVSQDKQRGPQDQNIPKRTTPQVHSTEYSNLFH